MSKGEKPSLEERIRAAMTKAALIRPPRLSDMEGRTLFGKPIVYKDEDEIRR